MSNFKEKINDQHEISVTKDSQDFLQDWKIENELSNPHAELELTFFGFLPNPERSLFESTETCSFANL